MKNIKTFRQFLNENINEKLSKEEKAIFAKELTQLYTKRQLQDMVDTLEFNSDYQNTATVMDSNPTIDWALEVIYMMRHMDHKTKEDYINYINKKLI